MESQINLWLHVLSFAVYGGATLALVAIGLPALSSEEDPLRRARLAAAMLKVYDPLSIGVLGVTIMTGAFGLTAYKAALRGAFFERLGVALAWKLFFTFILINVAAYIAFGIGHRVVSAVGRGEPPDAERLASFLSCLRSSSVLALILVAIIVWIALGMGGAAVAPPPAA